MQSKQKGNIAFSSVILELQKHCFNVFTEEGDFSRVDIIAEKNNKLIKIQVKYSDDKNGFIALKLVKSGPNGYRYTYSEKDVDWFAVYSPSTEKIAWISAKEVCGQNKQFNIRITPSKNKQSAGIHLIEDYSIDNLLKKTSSNNEDKIQNIIDTNKKYNLQKEQQRQERENLQQKEKEKLIEERRKILNEIDMNSFGWVMEVAKKWGVSWTQTKRWIKKYYPDLKYYQRNSIDKKQ